MLNLTCEITIGNYVFTEANAVVIRTGRNLLTGTARIVLANVGTYIGDPTVLDNAIAVDDPVEIKLGYDGDNKVEFVGTVREKRPNMPFEILCEDGMKNLRAPFSKNYGSVTLKQLIKDMVPDVVFTNMPEAILTDFRVNKSTVYDVLMEIKNTYPAVDLFFRDGKLHAQLPYSQKGNRIVYHLQDNVIRHELIFTKEADLKIMVRAISTTLDGGTIEVQVGQPGGNSTTLHFINTNEADMKVQAEAKLKQLKLVGNKGRVVAWGIPYAKHGDVAVWEDRFYPTRRQANFIDEVIVEWGANGFRRTIIPGAKEQNES